MKAVKRVLLCAVLSIVLIEAVALAETKSQGYTLAVLQFAPQDDSLKNQAAAISSLVQVSLTAAPDVIPVERADINNALEEVELNLSGNVNPDQAIKIGQLTGAQVIVVGRVFAVEGQLFAVAKVISTETSRVFGAVVNDTLRADINKMALTLSEKIMEILATKGDFMLPQVKGADTWVRDMKDLLTGRELPTVSVRVGERSMSSDIPAPSASTTIQSVLLELGASTIDPLNATSRAEIEFTGEAFSEFGLRKGNLVSSKGRIELRAVESSTGKVLAASSESAVAVDLGAEFSGKKAVEAATRQAMRKVLPVLINCCSKKLPANEGKTEPAKK